MTTQPALATDDLPEQMRVRRHKRERMLATGPHPYPVQVPRIRTLREIRDAHDDLAPDRMVHPGWLPGKLVEELFEHLVVPDLRAPTFVKDFRWAPRR